MPKYRIQVSIPDYWDYIVEAESEEEATLRGKVDLENAFDQLRPLIEVERVDDDAPVGDI